MAWGKVRIALEAEIDDGEEGDGGFGHDVGDANLEAGEELGVVDEANLDTAMLKGGVDKADGQSAGHGLGGV